MIITHDFHIHTNLSICAKSDATLEMYVEKAKELGLKKIAITNHFWDHAVDGWRGKAGKFYEIQELEHINKIKSEIDEFNKNNNALKILFGSEAEYCYELHRPAISPKVAEQMEVLLVPNSHTHIVMPKNFYEPYSKHIQFMIDAFMDIVNSDVSKYITAIPHPFMAVCCPYDNRILINKITDDQFKYCFSGAAENNIALEINLDFIRNKTLSGIYDDPIIRMYRIGKECGCKFTVGTDAHNSEGYNGFTVANSVASILDLKQDDFHPLTY